MRSPAATESTIFWRPAVVLSGSGQIKVDDDRFDLRALDAVRVAPGSAGELVAGDDGLEILAFGLHSPGDGEMVTDWAAA
jgi:gentisate 1,2-dioxygenase